MSDNAQGGDWGYPIYGDARNICGSRRTSREPWYARIDTETVFWSAVGIAFASLASYGLLFLWYQAVWNIFLGIPTPPNSSEGNEVAVFAFVTTVIFLSLIVGAVCVTTYRVKRASLDAEYRMKLAQNDHELQMKLAEAQAQKNTLPVPQPQPQVTGSLRAILKQSRFFGWMYRD